MNWDDYDVFCQVVEHGSFSAAARALERPKSSLSAAVIRLENLLQVRLLERTTRRLRLTEAGAAIHRGIGPLFVNLREAHAVALTRAESVSGLLRVAAPYEFGAHHLAPVACAMMQQFPALTVRIDVEHHHINPVAEGYDVVFSMLDGELPDSTLVLKRVFATPRGVYAAPTLLRDTPLPSQPNDLMRLALLAGEGDSDWGFSSANGSRQTIPVDAARLISANADVRLQAALTGLGVARITRSYCEPAVAAGRLVQLLPDFRCDPLRVFSVLPARRLMPEKVSVLLAALDAHALDID